ncbi:tRNA (guanine(46)-N(7))-methyltransferase TrmB [Actinotignum sp. GS-2025b]|uniref:tRNA (guanine(46)-N(7))-methyltransferase TrmB n=1 Tax=Actinotignum sp. GS-2025b TaxID=3427275 RepID=UPI003F459FFF
MSERPEDLRAAHPDAAPQQHDGAAGPSAPERSQWRIRSFSLRGSRLGARHEETVARHPELFVPLAPGPQATTVALDSRCDLGEVFGREAPLAVEIGPGSGEHGVSFAQRHPEYNMLLVEAWAPGAARCVASILRAGIENVRVLEADAAQALPVLFGLECAGLARGEDVTACGPARSATHPNAANPRAEQVWTFFPDPWRKARHHKRRLVAAPFATVVAGMLREGGAWRLATDWDNYAWQMRDVVESSPYFTNPHAGERPDPADPTPERGGFAPRWEERVLTRFEERGIAAGRTIHDILALRTALEPAAPEHTGTAAPADTDTAARA